MNDGSINIAIREQQQQRNNGNAAAVTAGKTTSPPSLTSNAGALTSVMQNV